MSKPKPESIAAAIFKGFFFIFMQLGYLAPRRGFFYAFYLQEPLKSPTQLPCAFAHSSSPGTAFMGLSLLVFFRVVFWEVFRSCFFFCLFVFFIRRSRKKSFFHSLFDIRSRRSVSFILFSCRKSISFFERRTRSKGLSFLKRKESPQRKERLRSFWSLCSYVRAPLGGRLHTHYKEQKET